MSPPSQRSPPGPDQPPTEAEIAYAHRLATWSSDEGGYQAIQSSKPQTLAFGLADSPVALASWIVEKFHGWTDCGGDLLSVWLAETLIDNLMIYWSTNTIGSSVRYYYEGTRLRPSLKPDDFVRVPTALAMWPHDLALAPRVGGTAVRCAPLHCHGQGRPLSCVESAQTLSGRPPCALRRRHRLIRYEILSRDRDRAIGWRTHQRASPNP